MKANLQRKKTQVEDRIELKPEDGHIYRMWCDYTSPYSWKLRAYMHYREIPYKRMVNTMTTYMKTIKDLVGMPIIPVILTHDNQIMQDTTPMMEYLEEHHVGPLTVPTDPRLAALNWFLEDMGDEYLVRYAMHYRWGNEQNRQTMSHRLARNLSFGEPHTNPKMAAPFILNRQKGFDKALGLGEDYAEHIDAEFLDLLKILEKHFEEHQFLLGDRPSMADFAFFGPLFAHVFNDPYSCTIMELNAPLTCDYLEGIRDLGDLRGLTGQTDFGDWLDADELPQTLKDLLQFAARTYVPFVVDNAKAVLVDQAKDFSSEISGQVTPFKAFAYRAWGLEQMQLKLAQLDGGDKAWLEALFTDTGVQAKLTEHGVLHSDLYDGFNPPFVTDGTANAQVRYLREKTEKDVTK